MKNFRNYSELSLKLHPRFNVLSGANGQGKTNFLEAVYYIGSLRSFRGHSPKEIRQWGEKASRITVKVEHEKPGFVRDLAVEIHPKRRKYFINGKTPASVGEYAQELSLVIFVPDDVSVARGAPEMRRRFLDRTVFGSSPIHLVDSLRYARALRARNALLKEEEPRLDLLDVFDQTIAELGARLTYRRKHFLETFLPLFRKIHQTFAPEAPEVGYNYRGPESQTQSELETELLALLKKGRERDIKYRKTGVGPHTDDLIFVLQEKTLRHFGSQGEQRTAILAWKIAEIHFLHQERKERPILLLDDVSSELDEGRSTRFFSYVCETEGQVFLTTTDPKHVHVEIHAQNRQDFRVHQGKITRM